MQGHDGKGFVAKLADFGLSKRVPRGAQTVHVEHGTEAYIPAEVWRTLEYSKAADIYAIGLLVWEAYHGLFWQAHHEMLKRLGCAPHCEATHCNAMQRGACDA